MSWQPIETAPKDKGVRVLVTWDALVAVGERSSLGGWWVDEWAEYKKPTHWMPLPEPPSE